MLINGTSENDNLQGTAGNDTLEGGSGDDTLLGGGGNDQITFEMGAKLVDGEEGDDLVALNFSEESADFTLVYNSTDGGVTSDGILSGTRIEGVEQVNVSSGGGDDNINISGASIGSIINTGTGKDYIIGSNGNDKLDSSSGDDTVIGGEKNDTIDGGIGNDILNGESGNDVITFGEGSKTVNGGGGNDRLELDFSGESADFTLTYNEFKKASLTTGGILDGTELEAIEQFNVASGSGDDVIDIAAATVGSVVSSGEGNDSLVGGLGDDELDGGSDNDTFFGGSGEDQIDGGAGRQDVAVFSGDRADYEITFGDDGVTVTDDSDSDSLTNVEFLRFENGDFNLETREFVAQDAESSDDDEADRQAVNGSTVIDTDPDGDPVFLLETENQSQFYTTDETERDTLLDTSPGYELTGVSFVGAEPPSEGDPDSGISPVSRFLNTDTDTYFYTADDEEKAAVTENLDNYVLEGTAYYSFDTQEEGTIPVYRLYNTELDTHFYTVSASERDSLLESSDFESQGGADGIAFYVEPAPEV
jgi:Ca2+-binding RTX toxin-like protein